MRLHYTRKQIDKMVERTGGRTMPLTADWPEMDAELTQLEALRARAVAAQESLAQDSIDLQRLTAAAAAVVEARDAAMLPTVVIMGDGFLGAIQELRIAAGIAPSAFKPCEPEKP